MKFIEDFLNTYNYCIFKRSCEIHHINSNLLFFGHKFSDLEIVALFYLTCQYLQLSIW